MLKLTIELVFPELLGSAYPMKNNQGHPRSSKHHQSHRHPEGSAKAERPVFVAHHKSIIPEISTIIDPIIWVCLKIEYTKIHWLLLI